MVVSYQYAHYVRFRFSVKEEESGSGVPSYKGVRCREADFWLNRGGRGNCGGRRGHRLKLDLLDSKDFQEWSTLVFFDIS